MIARNWFCGAMLCACTFGALAEDGDVLQAQPADGAKQIASQTVGNARNWSDYLTDVASGSVTAAGFIDLQGDTITQVQTVKDVVLAVKGLSSDGDDGSMAISVTPARTALAPISLAFYSQKGNPLGRLLGSTTFGFAQGDTDIEGAKFRRRAVSAETSYIFKRKHDQVIATALALAGAAVGDTCDMRSITGQHRDLTPEELAAAATAKEDTNEILLAKQAPDETNKELQKATDTCVQSVADKIPWNRSGASLAYATGWIKAKDGSSDEESLGSTVAASVTYGFDGFEKGGALSALSRNFALTAVFRKSFSEPVLQTVGTAAIEKRDTSLWIGQLEGGSKKIRALVQFSDADSSGVTASQRTFKQAIGLDARVFEDTWVNFRFGRVRSFDGDESEVSSLISLSYSPRSLLD